jgi:regulatory protein
MVVRFTPAGGAGHGTGSDSGGGSDGGAGRNASSAGGACKKAPRQESGLAPVTYLPGVKPSAQAEEALGRVERQRERAAVRAEDHDSTHAGKRPGARAANVSIHQLARRGMSRWELQQVLEKRDITDDVAEAELDRLERVGLLDDAALAVTLVYTQHTRKGLGRSAIAHELRRRHIDPDIIEDALSEIADDDERERALELAHKRIGQLNSVDDDTAYRRLNGFLARKGYSSEIIRAAVESAMKTRSGVRFQ